jgi:PTH1 family peptidyl-tRNA hydrolase
VILPRFRRRSPEDTEHQVDRWIAIGLANPEAQYGGSRHNLGADVVRVLASRLGASFKPHRSRVQAADTFAAPGSPLTLAIPMSYMNESGGPVQAASAFYKVPPERLVVVHDEIDLPAGVVRLKLGGGTAGHNGLKDVQRRLGTPDFHRVRIGVGRPPGRQDPADYVLKRPSAKERAEILDVAVEIAADAVLALVTDGLEPAQNRIHPLS